MFAFQTSRSNARLLSSEFPIGDPFAGPAYGEKTDFGTVLSVVAPAVISSVMGGSSADAQAQAAQAASATSAASADKATALQQQMFQAQQAAQAPYQAVGSQSINALANLMGVGQPGIPASGTVQAANAPYSGMSRDQIRAALLPQYTTTTQAQSQPQTQQANQQVLNAIRGQLPKQPLFGNAMLRQNIAQQVQAQQPQTVVNDAALNARIDQILAQQGQQGAQIQPSQATGQASPLGDFGSLAKPFSMANYQADPGYAFRLSEGMRGLEQSAAARGGLLSGNTLKGIQQYGQGLASQEYQNAYDRYQNNQTLKFNRLASLAGIGQTATNTLGQAGQNYASNAGNIGMSSAANQSNALLAAGQARSSSLGGIGQALGGVNWGQLGQGIGNFFSGGGGGNYTSNMGGVNTSLQGFYTPAV